MGLEIKRIPYASAMGSLMYTQMCTHSDIAYIVGMLGRYLSHPNALLEISQTGYSMLKEKKGLHAHM